MIVRQYAAAQPGLLQIIRDFWEHLSMNFVAADVSPLHLIRADSRRLLPFRVLRTNVFGAFSSGLIRDYFPHSLFFEVVLP